MMTPMKIKGLPIFFILTYLIWVVQGVKHRSKSNIPSHTPTQASQIAFLITPSATFTASTPTISNAALSSELCPLPLVPPPPGVNISNYNNCNNGCCIPCPKINVFYEENHIDTIYSVLSVFRVASFIGILFLVISYLFLPNKREQPVITVLNLSIFLLLFISTTFFYIRDHRTVQCASLIEDSTMTNNPFYCGFQGILLIFSTFGAVLWAFLLILHLHLQTVWRCDFVSRNYTALSVAIMLTTVIMTAIPAASNSISFDFGAVCLVSLQNSNEMFWGPLAVIVFPGFLIHCWTFVRIAKIQNRSIATTSNITQFSTAPPTAGSEIARAFKIQWRALFLALVFLTTVFIYWMFFTTQGARSKDLIAQTPPEWLADWYGCVYQNGGQNKCSILAKGHVPDISFLILAEAPTAFIGVNIFIIFGMRQGLWAEWARFFVGISRSRLRNLPESGFV